LKKIFSAILVMFFLSACGVPATPPATPTKTIIPTATATTPPISTPTLTPTPTTVPIPEFMNEFINLGYDKQSLNSTSIYVVLDEKATFYSSDEWGMKYKKSTIFAWSKVYYIDNGILQTNYVLMDFCTEISKYNNDKDVSIGCYVTPGDNVNHEWFNLSSAPPSPHTIKWTKSILNSLHEHSVGDYPIVQIEFNSEHFDARNDFSKIPNFTFFQDVYPTFNGQFATLKFPNIAGDFLPATYVGYDFSEGKWLKKP